ncbi:MAG: DUF2974 domain-containing protein [Treponema sp.]|nr:DUF2974 domain-containing protein [Treponema sp.]MBQ5384343.1 DUF2974 domain-containing protein [Treponema sp.]
MTNLFDYLEWRGDVSFSESPFNEIDGLLLSQISYIDFSGAVTHGFKDRGQRMDEVSEIIQGLPDFAERSRFSEGINPRTMELFIQAASTRRFSDVRMKAFSDILDESREEQFSAMTYCMKKINAVIYRGTDGHLVGWKEDCHLSCMDEIPAQASALEYLQKSQSRGWRKIIIAGHSKGGNLSIYAATKCPAKIRRKILRIYNYDGPGFEKEFFSSPNYTEISERICTFVPKFSIVGMLFNHTQNLKVVTSGAKGIMQHDPLSWETGPIKFPVQEADAMKSKYLNSTVNGWIDKLSREQRSQFVDAAFDILKKARFDETGGSKSNPIESAGRMISAYARLDPEARHVLQNTVQLLIKSGFENLGKGKKSE